MACHSSSVGADAGEYRFDCLLPSIALFEKTCLRGFDATHHSIVEDGCRFWLSIDADFLIGINVFCDANHRSSSAMEARLSSRGFGPHSLLLKSWPNNLNNLFLNWTSILT